jgi:signal transduction histidine kinase
MKVKERLEIHNELVRSKMINEALWSFSILAAISVALISFRAIQFGLTLSFFVQIPIAIGVWFTYYNRDKFSTKFKTYKLIASLIVILTVGMYNFSLLASTKHYLILLPVICSFLLPPKSTIKVFLILLFIYASFGLAYVKGWLKITFNPAEFISDPSTWIIDIFLISGAAFIILQIVKQYYQLLNEQYDIISKKNEEIRDKEETQRVLFESMNESVLLIKDDLIIDYNAEAGRFFGQRLDRNKEIHILSLFPKTQSNGKESKQIWENKLLELEKGNKPNFSVTLNRSSEMASICEVGLNLLELKHENYIQVIMKDITQRKKREDELRQYRIELEKRTLELQSINEDLKKSNRKLQEKNIDLENALDTLNKAKVQLIESEKMASIGILTAGVAHEINNPLNFIKSGLYGIESLIEDEEMIDSKALKNEINSITSKMNIGVEKVAEIVKSLNHFSRNNQTEFQPCSLNKILTNCLSILNHELKNKVAVKQSFLENDIELFGNESKLHQVFLNLMLNSIQSIEKTGEIEIKSRRYKEEAIISISDTGKGIPESVKSKIFDPFFTTKPAGQGTGLGLSIVLQIVKDHKGDINFASSPGDGTTATIILPAIRKENA